MNSAPVKVGLIGLGRMGQNHLRVLSILKDVNIVFISDINASVTERLSNAYGVKALANISSEFPEVDAIIICTPTITHVDYIKLATSRVKNILIEKPIARTLSAAKEISEFAINNSLNLQVGFIERFNPAVQALKSIIENTEKIISIDFTRTSKLSARITDVDVVTDLMIHDIDLALYLNGPAKSVSSHGFSRKQMIDFASALITHQNGQFSRIQASRVTDKKMRMIAATCIDMFVDCDLLRKEILINRQSEIKQEEGQPYTISAIQKVVEVKPQEALLSELQAFIASCRGKRIEGLPGTEAGLVAMEICDQIQKAIIA